MIVEIKEFAMDVTTVGGALHVGGVGISLVLMLTFYFALFKALSPFMRAAGSFVISALTTLFVGTLLSTNAIDTIGHAMTTWRHDQPVIGWMLSITVWMSFAMPIPLFVQTFSLAGKAADDLGRRMAARAFDRQVAARLATLRKEINP